MRLSDVFDLAYGQASRVLADAMEAYVFHKTPAPGEKSLTYEEAQEQVNALWHFRQELAYYYITDIEAGNVDLELAVGCIICHYPGGIRDDLIRGVQRTIDRDVADQVITQDEAIDEYKGAMLAVYQLESIIAHRLGRYFK